MTPEDRAQKCLELNDNKALNDSQYLPVDLEQRIAAAIRDAVAEEREACADITFMVPAAAPDSATARLLYKHSAYIYKAILARANLDVQSKAVNNSE